jgi:sulfate adenylyltransferase
MTTSASPSTHVKILDERELCDLECLLNGSFYPLNNYMTKEQYEDCLQYSTINYGKDIFPIPITLSLRTVEGLELGSIIKLSSATGIIHAELAIRQMWIPDFKREWISVFGTVDDNHPYISYIKTKNDMVYVSGEIFRNNTTFHDNYSEYRHTPQELSQLLGPGPVVGFQTRNPLHRSHIELIRQSAGNHQILLHPVEGVTQDCDIPFPIRMSCYKKILQYLPGAKLSILTLSMRMAGPKEALFHAIIRRNYGCSHFIVGRDHAGPSYKTKDGKPFYNPLAAQKLAKSLEKELGIQIITSEELVYCSDIKEYKQLSLAQASNNTIEQISGTELRSRLGSGSDIPTWYSYPEVVHILQEYYKRPVGVCFYFVGLSGAGKTTLAEALQTYIEDNHPRKTVTVLDANIIRENLSKGLGFSREDRSINVRRIGYVASEIVKHGGVAIVANIAPFQDDRDYNRKLISQYGQYVELFVDTPIEDCESRDTKGLYALARAGKIKDFTGVSHPFERPTYDDTKPGIVIPVNTKQECRELVIQHCSKLLN